MQSEMAVQDVEDPRAYRRNDRVERQERQSFMSSESGRMIDSSDNEDDFVPPPALQPPAFLAYCYKPKRVQPINNMRVAWE